MRLKLVLPVSLAALALALAGCHEVDPPPGEGFDPADPVDPGNGAPPPPPEPGPEDPGEGEGFRSLALGQHSGHRDGVERVISTEEEWSAFWETHTADETPAPERPAVDFESERVVAIVLTDRPNGCHYVVVKNVTEADGETRVDGREYTPSPDMVCTDVITQPFHFVAVPADGTDVVLARETVEGSPGG
jgi:hypothetical protein